MFIIMTDFGVPLNFASETVSFLSTFALEIRINAGEIKMNCHKFLRSSLPA
jgi:hypothetical protein